MSVEWGLSLPNRGVLFGATTIQEMLELSREAEASGFFSSLWVGDSLLDRPRVESIALLSALAVATQRLRLGVSCFASLVVRHPIELAIQWASVDIISGGRTVWVPCLGGGVERELAPFGVQRKDRIAKLKETLELIRRFWTEDEVSHDGRFFRFDRVRVMPKPIQKPHPPIWYAVTPDDTVLSAEAVDRALQRALDYAEGWQGSNTDATQIGRLCGRVQRLAQQASRHEGTHFPCSTHVHMTIDDSEDRAWELAKWYYDHYYADDLITERRRMREESIRRSHTWGPPQDCAQGILQFVAAGCSTIIIRFAARDQRTQLRRFLDEVAPILSQERARP